MERRWPVKVRPLRYYGGKQADGKSEWICGLLPWNKDGVYVETHGGMASVMSRRAPTKTEVYNDLDGRAVNWFQMWRERTDDMMRQVLLTPHSRQEYETAMSDKDHPDELRRAWAFHVVVDQSIRAGINGNMRGWRNDVLGKAGSLGRWIPERALQIVDRFYGVQFENEDACRLLNRLSKSRDTVIYCDPPYRTANTEPYGFMDNDIPKLTESLLSQRGQVAISGYGAEWDHLGWQRHEMEAIVRGMGEHAVNGSKPRTEVLWTNYDAHAEQAIGGLFAQE